MVTMKCRAVVAAALFFAMSVVTAAHESVAAEQAASNELEQVKWQQDVLNEVASSMPAIGTLRGANTTSARILDDLGYAFRTRDQMRIEAVHYTAGCNTRLVEKASGVVQSGSRRLRG